MISFQLYIGSLQQYFFFCRNFSSWKDEWRSFLRLNGSNLFDAGVIISTIKRKVVWNGEEKEDNEYLLSDVLNEPNLSLKVREIRSFNRKQQIVFRWRKNTSRRRPIISFLRLDVCMFLPRSVSSARNVGHHREANLFGVLMWKEFSTEFSFLI